MTGTSVDVVRDRRFGSGDNCRAAMDTGLKPGNDDAMLAAATIEGGDYGKINEYEGLQFRRTLAMCKVGIPSEE